MNEDIKYALKYHEETKHSEFNIRSSSHYLDWDNKPKAFKFYSKIPSTALPVDFPTPDQNVVTMIDTVQVSSSVSANIDIDIKLLSSLLFFSSGITRQIKFPHGKYLMRAAPATGALYPIEVYIVSKNINGLQAGIYHFCPGQFTLTILREGDYRLLLAEAAGDNDQIKNSPFTIILTSIAWRNAWKYQSRSYRHWFWDAGVIVSNLLAVAGSMHLYPRLIMGFMDDQLNRLLGLEDQKEASILIAALDVDSMKNNASQEQSMHEKILDSPAPKVYPLSSEEIDYPEIWKAYNSSKLFDSAQVSKWISHKRNGEVDKLDKKDNSNP